MNYLLFHCEMASALWNTIFIIVGLAWVILNRVVSLRVMERAFLVGFRMLLYERWFHHALCGAIGGKEMI